MLKFASMEVVVESRKLKVKEAEVELAHTPITNTKSHERQDPITAHMKPMRKQATSHF